MAPMTSEPHSNADASKNIRLAGIFDTGKLSREQPGRRGGEFTKKLLEDLAEAEFHPPLCAGLTERQFRYFSLLLSFPIPSPKLQSPVGEGKIRGRGDNPLASL
jgi:hypothetical protein